MIARVDRQSGQSASAPRRGGPPRCDAGIRDAEARAERVVDHALCADALRVAQPTVTER